MFNFDIDSWGAKPKKERKERIEELEEGDLDDIEEVERKPRRRAPVIKVQKDEFKIENYLGPSALTSLKTILTAYKSQYQKWPHQTANLKALCQEIGIDFEADLVVARKKEKEGQK